jgi:hypothetical protein
MCQLKFTSPPIVTLFPDGILRGRDPSSGGAEGSKPQHVFMHMKSDGSANIFEGLHGTAQYKPSKVKPILQTIFWYF